MAYGSHPRRHPLAFLLALTCVLMLSLLSCAPTGTSRGESGPGGESASAPKTLRMAFQGYHEPNGGLTSFGTVSAAGSTNLEHYLLFHANFTVISPQNSLEPRLVEKVPSLQEGDWKTFPDGRMEVTWRLRPDIRWHDGTPLAAEDFLFGMKVINDPELTVTRNTRWRLISEIQTPDPRTLVFVWKEPSILGNANGPDGIPALPQHRLAGLYQAGDKQAFENSPYWTTEFVGLGPYRLGQWQLGSFIEALAFEDYALGRPKIDRLILHYVGDVNAVIAGLLSGDLDMAPYGALLDADQVSTLRNAWGDRGDSVIMEKGVRSFWLQHRDPSAPWTRDVRVRQALVHSLDRPVLSATLQNDLAESTDILLSPEDAAYRIVREQGIPRYSHDLARAQQLLADAGWALGPDRLVRSPSGQTLDVEMRATAQGDNVKEMEAVAAFFSAAGLRPILSPIPAQADNKDELKNTSKGGLFWPYNFSTTAGQSLSTAQVASEATRWKGSNYSGFSNAGYDRLYSQFETTLDPSQRQQVLAQISRFVAEEIPLIPIYYNIQAVTVRKGVIGPGKASPMQAASAWNIHTWELKG